jgi:deoxyribose-phosphate aldolase
MGVPGTITARQIAKMVNHSMLRPDMTREEVAADCAMARKYDIISICIRPYDVAFCRRMLEGSDVRISAVVGFPHGNSVTETKLFEANRAMDEGAAELDMVLPIGMVRSGEWQYAETEVRQIVEAAHGRAVLVKVIFEDCLLSDDEVVHCCRLCEAAGADYVKTSTGYGAGGATVSRVRLMRASCPPRIGVKAAGGIRTLDQFLLLLDAGAVQQGTRSTKTIIEEALERECAGTLVRAGDR